MPGEISLGAFAGDHTRDASPTASSDQQAAPVPRNVDEPEISRRLQDDPFSPLQRYCAQLPALGVLSERAREPDFIALRRPGDRVEASPSLRQRRPPAPQVHDRQGSGAVEQKQCFDESDPVPPRRDPWRADPTGRLCLVEDLADRILQPLSTRHLTDDRELSSVGAPVRVSDVLEDLARRAARERRPGKNTVLEQRHLSRRRDRSHGRSRKGQHTGLPTLRPGRVELERFAVPRSAVDDRVAVRGKLSGPDRAAAEGQRLEGRGQRRSLLPEAPAGQDSGRENPRRWRASARAPFEIDERVPRSLPT